MTDEQNPLEDAAENAAEKAGDAADELQEKGKEVLEDIEEGVNDAVEKATEIIHAENKKVLTGVLAIVVGGFGVHKFVLGYTTEGIIQIALTFVTCGIGAFVPLIEGIIYLTKSDDEFYQTYQANKKGWF